MALPTTMPANDLTVVSTLTLNSAEARFYVAGEYYGNYNGKVTFPITFPDDPTVDGYTFKGWEAEGYDTAPTTMPADGVTFHAILEASATEQSMDIRGHLSASTATSPFGFKFMSGMTWKDWFDSSYVTDGVVKFYSGRAENVDGNIVAYHNNTPDNKMPVCSDVECTQPVMESDLIIAGHTYWAKLY